MRVACVNQDPGIQPDRHKGAAVHLAAMREAFASLGADVVAVDEADGERLRRRLEAAWREAPLDLVYERYALGRSTGAEFARGHRLPLVLEVNAPLAEEAHLWRGETETDEARRREELVFRSAARVIAVSSKVAEYVRVRGAAPEAVRVFPNGVDTRLFQPRSEGNALRSEVVPGDRLAIGFHGRLRPWHGFPLLARACARLLEDDVPVHLLVVGEGSFEEHLEGLVPPERVTRIGWRPHAEVARLVACFDVLPLTYTHDAPCYFSPLKLAEAMASGVVPVVPRLGDLGRIVEDGRDGVLYDADDLEQLVRAVASLRRRPEERERLARNAVETARGMSWRRIARYALECVREEVSP